MMNEKQAETLNNKTAAMTEYEQGANTGMAMNEQSEYYMNARPGMIIMVSCFYITNAKRTR